MSLLEDLRRETKGYCGGILEDGYKSQIGISVTQPDTYRKGFSPSVLSGAMDKAFAAYQLNSGVTARYEYSAEFQRRRLLAQQQGNYRQLGRII